MLRTSTSFYWDGNMNAFTFRARRSAVILSVSLACSLPAFAQSTANGGSSAGAGSTGTTTSTRDDGRDYGWLGLLGLVGLLGLRKRPDDHRDVNRTTTTSR